MPTAIQSLAHISLYQLQAMPCLTNPPSMRPASISTFFTIRSFETVAKFS